MTPNKNDEMKTVRYLAAPQFSLTFEAIHIFLPVFFLVAGLVELTVAPSFTTIQRFLISLLSEFVFFNSLHVLLTVLVFMNHAEYRTFIKTKSDQIKESLLFRWAIAYLFFTAVTVYVFCMSQQLTNVTTFTKFIIQLAVMYRIHHSLTQNVGISLLYYSSQTFKNPSINKNLNACLFVERLFLPVILLECVATLIGQAFTNSSIVMLIFLVNVLITSILISVLNYFSRRLDSNFSTVRVIFAVRYFLYPLAFLSVYGAAGVAAVHGFEYLFLNQKINGTKNIDMLKNARFSFYIFALLFAFSGLVTILYFLSTPQTQQSYFYLFLVSFVLFQSMTFMHFYVDRHIYKFKDLSVQQTVGTLFFDKQRVDS